ncbi:hypothetical protein BHE74_00055686 [Ensete ventricosum]|nr:hypothetical protein GW17_00000144 [Ensete ventricosum]RWW39020.1 hypothetical protein BHE74_00055686 [Ensete ventricosum]RZR96335.1 hypothetical protein BHM03_00025322 [Ensete ventricosum]
MTTPCLSLPEKLAVASVHEIDKSEFTDGLRHTLLELMSPDGTRTKEIAQAYIFSQEIFHANIRLGIQGG